MSELVAHPSLTTSRDWRSREHGYRPFYGAAMKFGIAPAQVQRLRKISAFIQSVRYRSDLEPCVYCGVAADTVDHVPPRSARDVIIAQGLALKFPFYEVPCCHECNSVLGARSLWTLGARRDYVKKSLRRRYSDVLRIPDWTDAELGQLSPRMRDHVLSGLNAREFIRERIAFRDTIARAS